MLIIFGIVLGVVMFAAGYCIGYRIGEENFRKVLKEKGLL